MTLKLDFGSDGKMLDCAVEHVGALPIFAAPADLDTIFCKASMQRGEIKPFTDGDGDPKPRRVVVKTSIEHVEIPAASVEPATGQ